MQCEESNESIKKAESNVGVAAVESVDVVGVAISGAGVQCDRKIRRAIINVAKIKSKAHGVKWVKRKQKRRQMKTVNKVQSFGNFLDTQLRKITNQAYRDKTERDILRLLLDRIENEPVKLANLLLFPLLNLHQFGLLI